MKTIYIIFLTAIALTFNSCNKFLDRPPLTTENDESAWKTEDNVRMYANKYYTDFFVGYGLLFDAQDQSALLSFTNSDDVLNLGNQSNVTRAVPNTGVWDYRNIRSLNIMLDRVDKRMSGILSAEAKAHWLGIGRFFRAFRYSQLVLQYGDVPYITREVFDHELEELYKDRTSRNEVMDGVYDDLMYAYQNVRLNDGIQNVNRYVVAAYITRLALFEGSWQKYYYKNTERAKKFLQLAVDAGSFVINSGRYDIVMDYKSLFTSKDLTGAKDAVLFRKYDAALGVTHSVASYSNLVESRNYGPTTDLIKSYICVDGKTYNNSSVAGAANFGLESLIKSRDSRFEATFYSRPEVLNRSSLIYVTKFLPRDAEKRVKEDGLAPSPEFTGSNNETDYPVMRYAEVLLNWVEAKAELANLGEGNVTQSDIDITINKLRGRPLAVEAQSRGVQKTVALLLSSLPADPDRDFEISDLLWEIRRERRMEFTFEYSRLVDLRRWSKMDYMDTDANKDLLSGGWVKFSTELPAELKPANVGVLSVVSMNGTQTIYNGSNASVMEGFYRSTTNGGRLPFLNQIGINPYLQPVSIQMMDLYKTNGYELKQTEGWTVN